MATKFENFKWIEDLLPQSHVRKSMFGGFAYYVEEKLTLLLFESYGNKSYRDQRFDFEIWNGCMFPVEKENQMKVLNDFPFLINHPILPKWLYLPTESEDFESRVEAVLREIRRHNILFGTFPKRKKTKKFSASSKKERINTRVPQMFRDESATEALSKAKKISDLKNFGPETEKAFHKVGIKTAQQFIKLGWKKTLEKLSKKNPKYTHSLFAYAMIGALKNQDWSSISDEDKNEAQAFCKSLRKSTKTFLK